MHAKICILLHVSSSSYDMHVSSSSYVIEPLYASEYNTDTDTHRERDLIVGGSKLIQNVADEKGNAGIRENSDQRWCQPPV